MQSALTVLTALAWGALSGLWTPRGPLTAAQALVTMAVSLAVGAAGGYLSGSRWAMLSIPAAFTLAVEVARLRVDGPTVDAVQLSTYGLLAFVVGRVVTAVLTLVPLVLGAAVGAGVRRRARTASSARPRRAGRYARRSVAAVTALALVGLAALLAVPARTAPVPGGISELTTVRVGGHDLGLMLRGRNPTAPVLLYLAGGPGGSELGAMRRHLPDLARDFVVATLDQRGTGRSYSQLDPATTLTLESAVQDVLAVTDYLRGRFGGQRVVLCGQSYGSLLGVLAVARRPEAFSGFIGVGQMVSPLETDRVFYRDTLAWARARADTDLVARLEAIGRPPYSRMLDYETALSYEHEVYPYDHRPNHEGAGGFSENFVVEEYALLDKLHLLGAFMDTFAVLYPQLQDVDFRRTVRELAVPVFFVQGGHEAPGRAIPFQQWYPELRAPVKDVVVLATSGHRPLFEQPQEFTAYLRDRVLPRLLP